MSREKKFRVYNGIEMIYDVMVGRFGNFYVNPMQKGNGLDEKDSASITPFNTKYPDSVPLMEFTGLKDKNKIDIWEGDIVRGKLISKYGDDGTLPTLGVVEYCEGYAAFCLKNDGGQTLFHNHVISLFEVIGNIYQTPKLLQNS